MDTEDQEKRTDGKGLAEIPGLWRFLWLLFMQPLTLHRMFLAWGLEGDPSWWSLRSRLGRDDPIVRRLWRQVIIQQLVVTPLLTVTIALIYRVVEGPIAWRAVAASVVGGVMASFAFGMLRGVAFSVASGVAVGAACTAALFVGPDTTLAVVVGVTGGMAFTVSLDTARGAVMGVRFVVALGVVSGVVLSATSTVPYQAGLGAIRGVIGGMAVTAGGLRVPIWLFEVPWAVLVMLLVRLTGKTRLVRHLPFVHDELIYLPIPGLSSFLVDLGDTHPELLPSLLDRASTSPGLQRTVDRVTTELQSRALERAVRNRLYERLSDFDLPFLPPPTSLDDNSPLRHFHAAGRDLAAGGTSQRHRHAALLRAQRLMQTFRQSPTPREKTRRPLHERLQATARLWLDVIEDELRKLSREASENPEVPPVFVAGIALTPERPDETSLFKGRRDVSREIEHDLMPDRRGVIVLQGQRRMGKSSLARWLPRLLGTGTTVVTADFQGLSGHPQRAAPHRIVLDAIAHTPDLTLPSAPPESERWSDALTWLRALDASLPDNHAVLVVIDEVERLQTGLDEGWTAPDFLDFLRAAGDALRRVRFLLLTAYPLARLGEHWIDRLISVTPRAISYLDEPDARELLVRPVPDFPDIYPDGGVDRIVRETGRHPFLLQKVGDELVRRVNARPDVRDRKKATDDDITRAFDTVIENGIPFAELWRQRTPPERKALARIAHDGATTERTAVLRQLTREGYLVEREGRWEFAVPLFRAWVEAHTEDAEETPEDRPAG